MLPRKNRISKNDFPAPKRPAYRDEHGAGRQGLRVFSPLFSGVIYKNEGLSRSAVVVSKKTAKTAVARNRIRRRFYAVLEPILKESKQGGMMVFYPKKEVETAPFAVLKSEIETALQKFAKSTTS